jgi:hypothetical protein
LCALRTPGCGGLVVTVFAGGGGDVGNIFGHFFEKASLNHPRCGCFEIAY